MTGKDWMPDKLLFSLGKPPESLNDKKKLEETL